MKYITLCSDVILRHGGLDMGQSEPMSRGQLSELSKVVILTQQGGKEYPPKSVKQFQLLASSVEFSRAWGV